MATLARVVCDGAEGTTRHAQDVTGGRVLARGDIMIVDIDEPHEADLVETGILRILEIIFELYRPIIMPAMTTLPGATTI